MKKISQIIVSVFMLVGIGTGVLATTSSAHAINVFPGVCSTGTNAKSDICQASKKDTLQGYVKPIVNILLYILGAVAVIMIIVGGFMYVTSGGDQTGVTKAKNTILYSVVGLVVAILAYAIVNFVINAIK